MATRIITFLVENPYKPLFATVTGKGSHPKYRYMICSLFFYEGFSVNPSWGKIIVNLAPSLQFEYFMISSVEVHFKRNPGCLKSMKPIMVPGGSLLLIGRTKL